MNTPVYDAPEIEQQWCDAQRSQVIEYLRSQGVNNGDVGEWPAWHVAPMVSVWAVASLVRPGWIGWWAISGDLPTDYISSADIEPPQHPRKALRAIAELWLDAVRAWDEGREYENFSIAGGRRNAGLAALLESRARIFIDWTDDDSYWEEEPDQ